MCTNVRVDPAGAPSLKALGIRMGDRTVVIRCADGVQAAYALPNRARPDGPTPALLLDLDGTSLLSEEFWVEMLNETMRMVTGANLDTDERLLLRGATTRDHLTFLIDRHHLDMPVAEALKAYDTVVTEAFYERTIDDLAEYIRPAPGFAELRAEAERLHIPMFLVTNGNQKKAMVEVAVLAHHLKLKDQSQVANGLWCAPRSAGWMNSFGATGGKPHPWPYLEAATKGARVPHQDLCRVIAADDSAAGVCSIRLAGLRCFGIGTGNIEATGAAFFCEQIIRSLEELIPMLRAH